MKKSYLFSLFAAILVALLMTSVAQAKKGGNNPGDDNEGSTYVDVPFIAQGYLGAGISCYNPPEFCQDYYLDAVADSTGGFDTSAYASAYLGCTASSAATAGFGMQVFAEGNLHMARHGLNGAMHHIEMSADFGQTTVQLVEASAHADTFTSGEANAHAFAQNYAGECNSLGLWPDVPSCWFDYCRFADLGGHPDWQDLCIYVDSYGHGDAYSHATASSYGNGWSNAYSLGSSGMSSWTGVWAANIERFAAIVSAGASEFSFSTASANAGAMVDVYANAYMDAYSVACADLYNYNDIFWSVCADGYASAWANAYSYAGAYADANASAFQASYVGMTLPALYVNENGPVDTVIFGDESGGGDGGIYGGGLVELSCSPN